MPYTNTTVPLSTLADLFLYNITPPNAMTGAGAVSILTPVTNVTTNGVGNALPLAAGTIDGQRKTVSLGTLGGGGQTFILTPAGGIGGTAFTTFTGSAAGHNITLQWDATAALWKFVSSAGGALA